MEKTHIHKSVPRRTLATSSPISSYSSYFPPEKDEDENKLDIIFRPTSLFIKIISFKLGFFSYCLSSLSTPLISFISMATESLHRADMAREKTEDVVLKASRVPSNVAESGELLLKKIGFGLFGAVYVGLVLIVIMGFSVLFGVGLVRFWVEEPVFMKETVYFDYTEVHPTAVITFSDGGGCEKKKRAIPVGHTYYVSLLMLMPESDFNRQIGVFQVLHPYNLFVYLGYFISIAISDTFSPAI